MFLAGLYNRIPKTAPPVDKMEVKSISLFVTLAVLSHLAVHTHGQLQPTSVVEEGSIDVSQKRNVEGRDVIRRTGVIPTGSQKSFVDTEVPLSAGLLEEFYCFIHNRSDFQTRQSRSLYIQIWRTIDDVNSVYQLEFSQLVNVTIDPDFGLLHKFDVHQIGFKTQEGMLIGITNIYEIGLVSFEYAEGTKLYYRNVNPTSLPQLGVPYTFLNLPLPAIMSFAVKITPILCEVLTDPENGNVVATGNRRGDSATFACETGYSLVGTRASKCRKSGLWKPVPPTCIRDQTGQSHTVCSGDLTSDFNDNAFKLTVRPAMDKAEAEKALVGSVKVARVPPDTMYTFVLDRCGGPPMTVTEWSVEVKNAESVGFWRLVYNAGGGERWQSVDLIASESATAFQLLQYNLPPEGVPNIKKVRFVFNGTDNVRVQKMTVKAIK